MKTVLVVDDDRVLLDALALELGRMGYAAQTAGSVDEALAALAARPTDVLVTDLRMRGRDGIDLLRACREQHPRTRMVLMSAYATARDYKVARSVGAVEVLVKPFAPEEFADAVRRAESFDAGFQADVLGLTLVDVLQLFHHGRRSVAVRVGEIGVIHMLEGEIIHATTPRAKGPTALIEILSVEGGVISTGAPESVHRSFTRPFETLLLGTLALIDERRASRPVHDGDVFTSAQPQAVDPVELPSRPSGGRTTRGSAPRSSLPSMPPMRADLSTSLPPAHPGLPATGPVPRVAPEPTSWSAPPAPSPPVASPPPAPLRPQPAPSPPPVVQSRPPTPLPLADQGGTPPAARPADRNRGLGLALVAVFAVVLLITLGRPSRPDRPAPSHPGAQDGGQRAAPRSMVGTDAPPSLAAGLEAPSERVEPLAPAPAGPGSVAAPASAAALASAAPASAAPASATPGPRVRSVRSAELGPAGRSVRAVGVTPVAEALIPEAPVAEAPIPEAPATEAPATQGRVAAPPTALPVAAPPSVPRPRVPQVEILDELDQPVAPSEAR